MSFSSSANWCRSVKVGQVSQEAATIASSASVGVFLLSHVGADTHSMFVDSDAQ